MQLRSLGHRGSGLHRRQRERQDVHFDEHLHQGRRYLRGRSFRPHQDDPPDQRQVGGQVGGQGIRRDRRIPRPGHQGRDRFTRARCRLTGNRTTENPDQKRSFSETV